MSAFVAAVANCTDLYGGYTFCTTCMINRGLEVLYELSHAIKDELSDFQASGRLIWYCCVRISVAASKYVECKFIDKRTALQ